MIEPTSQQKMIVMKPMSSHTVKPSDLAPGVYWYMVPGKPAEICEKREGEAFARFINGRHQSWIRPGESFVGPFPVPETPGGEMEEGAATTFG